MHFISRLFAGTAATAILTSVIGVSIGAAILREEQARLPDISPIVDYKPKVHTSVFSADGQEVFRFGSEQRELIPLSSVPRKLIDAFVAAEDQNFWHHEGYDGQAILRAAVTNASSGSVRSGASTITQQLTKNLVLTPERSISRKIQELLIAIEVEKRLTKGQILERYLNEIYLGRGAYGISTAAEIYFDKHLSELTLSEAAYLAGLPKAPSMYSNDLTKGAARRAYVLDRMLALGMIATKDHSEAKASPLTPRNYEPEQGRQSHFIQAALPGIKGVIGDGFLGEDKYEIHLTLDREIQKITTEALQVGLTSYDQKKSKWRGSVAADAEIPVDTWQIAEIASEGGRLTARLPRFSLPISKASIDWTRRSKKPLTHGDLVLIEVVDGKAELRQTPSAQGAVVVMDAKTGDVLALTGAFSESTSFFNRAVGAERQPGSALKPFIYGTALQNGWSPTSPILDTGIALDAGPGQDTWRPKDHGYSDLGFVTLRNGLVYSRNTVTIRLFEALGATKVQDTLRQAGIYKAPPAHTSLALGATETSLLKVVSGYSALADDGIPKQPNFLKEILRNGRQLPVSDAASEDLPAPLFDDITLAQLRSMLLGVTTHGTARRAFTGFDDHVFGKTGTTNDARDVWFIGFNRDVVVGAFIGFDEPKSLGRGVAGGNTAAPIVRSIFDQMPEHLRNSKYPTPEGARLVRVNSNTGLPDANGILEIERLLQ